MDDGYGYGYGSGQASAAALLFTHAIHDGPPTAALYAERARAGPSIERDDTDLSARISSDPARR
jgi:hypothetical protein